MITTSALAARLGISQSAIQKRIKRAGVSPMVVGRTFVLSDEQAQKVRETKDKPGRKPAKAGQSES